MAGELFLQPPVAGKGDAVDGDFDRDIVPERGRELSPGLNHQVNVDDSIGPFIDPEDHVLKVLGTPATINSSAFRSFLASLLGGSRSSLRRRSHRPRPLHRGAGW